MVHTRNWYSSSNRLEFKAIACKVGDLNPSWFFISQKETHLSEERASVLMVYSLKVVQSGQLLIRDIIKNADIHPSFSFPTATTQSLYICKCRQAYTPAGQGKKTTGRTPSWAEISCATTSHTLHPEASNPPHFHQPNQLHIWGFLHHLGLKAWTHFFHVSLPGWRNPSPRGLKRWGLPSAGTGTCLESSFSDSALSIQMSGYTTAPVKKESNLVGERKAHSKRSSLHLRNFPNFIKQIRRVH